MQHAAVPSSLPPCPSCRHGCRASRLPPGKGAWGVRLQQRAGRAGQARAGRPQTMAKPPLILGCTHTPPVRSSLLPAKPPMSLGRIPPNCHPPALGPHPAAWIRWRSRTTSWRLLQHAATPAAAWRPWAAHFAGDCALPGQRAGAARLHRLSHRGPPGLPPLSRLWRVVQRQVLPLRALSTLHLLRVDVPAHWCMPRSSQHAPGRPLMRRGTLQPSSTNG